MADVIVFGGTAEGRELAEFLKEQNIPTVVCVTSAYGESLLEAGGCLRVSTGALPPPALHELFRKEKPRLVVDATHPYAVHISGSLRQVCGEEGLKLCRVIREPIREEGLKEYDTLSDLIEDLNRSEGEDVVFSSLGVKSVPELAGIRNAAQRVWVRVLPVPSGIQSCMDAGFPAAHIIGMQGPFSTELNEAMFASCHAKVLITKESGVTGGFPEKVEAARRRNMTVAVIRRPAEEGGLSLEELKERIRNETL